MGGWVGLPNGEVFGEMSGGVFRENLTIQPMHKERDSGNFGEVLGFFRITCGTSIRA